MKRRTSWFHADVRPARVGYYERVYDDAKVRRQYWDGLDWWVCLSNGKAVHVACVDRDWRGLTEPQ